MSQKELEWFIQSNRNSIMEFYKNNYDDFEVKLLEVVAMLKKHKESRVHITGVGKCSYVANYGASLFSSIGTPCYFLDATETIHGSAGQVRESDIVIAISNSGETEELKLAVQALKNNGIKIVGITGNNNSWLAKKSDILLEYIISEEGDTLNKAPRNSVTIQMLIIQCLSILIQKNNDLTLEEYLKYHPGGNLGKLVENELNED